MKYLLLALPLMLTMVSCNKNPEKKYSEERMEAKKDFNEDMRDVQKDRLDAVQKRDEKIDEAKKDLNEDLNDRTDD